ncbi:hypothetical protein PI124_g12248 [Phytophthora idaei]|nr:hypothetical protein PI126_g11277 [Phytophthora idaei]KAG3242930.1 hypothetical protein PI124_g12248 [Phytophthora idaei]
MKHCETAGTSASDEEAPGPSSDLATIREKLVEVEEYTRQLVAVQGELQDLRDQENECTSEISSLLFNVTFKDNDQFKMSNYKPVRLKFLLSMSLT